MSQVKVSNKKIEGVIYLLLDHLINHYTLLTTNLIYVIDDIPNFNLEKENL